MLNLILTEVLLVVCLLIALTWYIQFHVKRRRLYKLAAKLNGPRALPLIGNIRTCLIPLTEIIDAVINSIHSYKSPQRFWFGPKLIVHIFDPKDIKIILNSPHALAKEPNLYKMLELAAGRGLSISPLEEWKRHRKLIAPSFNRKLVNGYFDTFCCRTRMLVRSLKAEEGKEVFDIQEYLIKFAMGSIMDVLFGFSGDLESATNISLWTNSMLDAVLQRCTTLWYFPDVLFKMSALGRKTFKTKQMYDDLIDSLIEKWRKISVKQPMKENGEESTTKIRPLHQKRLIEYLLEVSDSKGEFTVEELRGEVNNIIVGGYETVATTVGFSLVMLGMHPEIQEKTRQEVTQVLGSKQELNFHDLKSLKYLETVIKETLRIYPIAVGSFRYTDQEIQLTSHIIPAKTAVAVGIMTMHRHPDIWPNPNTFNPDRFKPEEAAKRHPYSWIPFSAGSRNCVGIHYAMLAMKIVLSALIRRYKITTEYKSVEDVRLTLLFKLQPTDGFKISITPN